MPAGAWLCPAPPGLPDLRRAQFPLHQAPRSRFLILVGDLLQGCRSGFLVHTFFRQFPAERTLGQLAGLRTAPHPHVGEIGVIDKAGFLELVQDRLSNVLRDVPLGKLAGQLKPAFGRRGQLPVDNGPGHREGIRFGVLRNRRVRVRAVRVRICKGSSAPPAGPGPAGTRIVSTAQRLEPVNGLQLRGVLGLGLGGLHANAKLFLDQPLQFGGELRVVAEEPA
jgi:hypothetical protein